MASKVIQYQNQQFSVSYEILENHAAKNMIFLHGWGSNKALMRQAFEGSFQDFNHCYIDLPGFGKSPNEIPLFTKDYAQIIKLFLEAMNLKADIVVGHSFGGKIAALLDYEIILLSSAGIPEDKPLNVRLKILCAKVLKTLKIQSSFLRSKDANQLNQGMYQTFKNVVNEDFTPIFENFDHKACIFWGKEDRATSLQSGQKISKLIKNSRFYALDGDHFFFLRKSQEIQKLYLKGLDETDISHHC